MHHARLAILAVSIGVGFVASAQPPTGTRPRANIAAGKELFTKIARHVTEWTRRVIARVVLAQCMIRIQRKSRDGCHRPI